MRQRARRVLTSVVMLAVNVVAQTTVTTSGGTANVIPMFTGTSSIGNSVISQGDTTVNFTNSSAKGAALMLYANSGSLWNAASIYSVDTGPNGRQYAFGSRNGIGFSLTDETAGAYRLVVTPTGNVGIGIASPPALLSVNGPNSQSGASTYALIGAGYAQTGGLNGNRQFWIQQWLNAVTARTFLVGNGFVSGTSGAIPNNGPYTNFQALEFQDNYFGLVWNNAGAISPAVTVNPSNGFVGIGTSAPGAGLEVNGNLKLSTGSGGSITFPDGTVQSTAFTGVGGTCGGDYAESVDVAGDRAEYEAGDVLAIDPNFSGKFLKSAEPYSTTVTGIYSTKPGVVGRRQSGVKSSDEVPMAMVGIVPVKVSAENGPVKVGDLLVTASLRGYAMKGTDRKRMLGAVIGKALGALDSGTGVIEVVVTLQ